MKFAPHDEATFLPALDTRIGELHFDAILAARQNLAGKLTPTPMVTHPLLSRRLGCEVAVKLENAQALGSFKVRGGLNLIANLSAEEKQRGLVTATRGNHGQSMAHACRIAGVPCAVFVPEGNNPDKNAAMIALGAEVQIAGHDFDAAWDAASRRAAASGAIAVHPSRDARLVAGYATVALEMLEQATQPLDFLIVPVGGGSLAAGVGLAVKALSPHTKVIGVAAEAAPAMARAFHSGECREFAIAATIADGLAQRVPWPDTVAVLRACLDDVLTVNEAEIHTAIRTLAETVHQMAEGAGAAALAGAFRLRARLAGHRIGVVLSGGNITSQQLMSVLHGDPVGGASAAADNAAITSMNYGYN
jgi:threonine dehydratase